MLLSLNDHLINEVILFLQIVEVDEPRKWPQSTSSLPSIIRLHWILLTTFSVTIRTLLLRANNLLLSQHPLIDNDVKKSSYSKHPATTSTFLCIKLLFVRGTQCTQETVLIGSTLTHLLKKLNPMQGLLIEGQNDFFHVLIVVTFHPGTRRGGGGGGELLAWRSIHLISDRLRL